MGKLKLKKETVKNLTSVEVRHVKGGNMGVKFGSEDKTFCRG